MGKRILIQKRKLCHCKSSITITYSPAFAGLPCNNYCCGCCPHKKESPCPKEKKSGTVSENLFSLQHPKKTVKKIRVILIIADNLVVKRFMSQKSNEKLKKDCEIRHCNTGKKTTFAILPEHFFNH